MTHYLRINGNSIVDLEETKSDLHCVVNIRLFSILLLSLNAEGQSQLITDMDDLQEIRGEWFEGSHDELPVPSDENHQSNLNQFIKRRFQEIAKKWILEYVTD